MIGYLRGNSIRFEAGVMTLVCGDVGYEVHLNENDAFMGESLSWAYWIHVHAPKDAPNELYGFREREQRDLFRKLLDIKGVGPKVAMRIVAATPMFQKVGGWIASDFEKIRGVGSTLAQRIIEAMQ